MSRYKGTNVPKQPTVPPMPKKRRYIDESILVEKVYNGEGLPTISRSVLVNCVLPTIPTADVVEVVRCKDCVYYDPPHVEDHGKRLEYKDLPKEAFDDLGTGLVSLEYGINVGGRCYRDYNAGYSEDKRIYVSESNYCGRAERTDK